MLGDVSVLDDEFPSVLRVLTAVAAAHAPTLAAWAGASVASLSGGGAPPRRGRQLQRAAGGGGGISTSGGGKIVTAVSGDGDDDGVGAGDLLDAFQVDQPIVVINPIKIIVSGTVSAGICIPAMLLFALLFQPERAFACFKAIFCLPCKIYRLCCCCCPGGGKKETAKIAPSMKSHGHIRCPASRASRRNLSTISSKSEAGDDGGAGVGGGANAAKLKAAAKIAVIQPKEKKNLRASLPGGRGRGKPSKAPPAAGATPNPLLKLKTAGKLAMVGATVTDDEAPVFSYESLNEVILKRSLIHTIAKRRWRRAAVIALGWLLNWILFGGMLLLFAVYCCVLLQCANAGDAQNAFLLTWLWSVLFRFALQEPFLICCSFGVPLLFAGECLANVCGEAIGNVLAAVFDMFFIVLFTLAKVR